MKRTASDTNESLVQGVVATRPRLVKASEFAARREAAAEAERVRVQQAQLRPSIVRAPRGEVEARAMFDQLFEAA